MFYFRNLCTLVTHCLLAVISLVDFAKYANGDAEISLRGQGECNLNDYTCEGNLEGLFRHCTQISQERQGLEERLTNEGRVENLSGRDSNLVQNFRLNPYIQDLELAHLPFEDISNQLYTRFNLSVDTVNNVLPTIQLNGEYSKKCREACRDRIVTATCDPNSKYRRIDGQCNNLQNPDWGSANVCQQRLLPPNYVGTSGFRVSVNGDPLPRSRTLSLNIHYNLNRPTNNINHLFMFYAQLLSHDIVQTPQTTISGNRLLQCCPAESATHPQCAPIIIAEDDPFYSQFNVTCLNFVRSVFCPTCTLGPKQIIDVVTSAIDASFVYGINETITNSLRTNDNTGRLRTQTSTFGDLLPPSSNPTNDQCSFPDTNDICFEAGDNRVNQQPVLTSLQTIFLREHNRIATQLREINPGWDDEKLFQETRRIIGAEMQAIAYKEYLPIALGENRMWEFRLWTGHRTQYDPNEDLTVLVEFSTAANRYGHSLINAILSIRPLNASNGFRLLRDNFFQPYGLYQGLLGPLIEGVPDTPAQSFDRYLVLDITGFLYKFRNETSGSDLAATNIQRGRDHGAPTYVDTVRYCTGGRVNIASFDDLGTLMESEQVEVLRNNYRFVQDIDLWTGMLSERNEDGAVVGPTVACIVGLQFHKLKYGDRFYFEHENEAGSFTDEQLEEIRGITLTRIICLNSNVQRMPQNALLFNSENNPYIECRNVNSINLSYWQE